MQTPALDLETATAQQILTWALATHGPRVGLTSSFGIESAALLHMATRIDPDVRVILLDTGYLFPETLRYAESLRRHLGLNLRVHRATPDDIRATRVRLTEDSAHGEGRCCDVVKVRLLQEALRDLDCWIAGLRRDQSAFRSSVPAVQTLPSGLVKVHPLAGWTAEQVRGYLVEHGLPIHPLWYRGYTSVGCWPCTTRPTRADDLRSGRWPELQKTECGIHVAVDRAREGR